MEINQHIACFNPNGTIGFNDMYIGQLVDVRNGRTYFTGRAGSMFEDRTPNTRDTYANAQCPPGQVPYVNDAGVCTT